MYQLWGKSQRIRVLLASLVAILIGFLIARGGVSTGLMLLSLPMLLFFIGSSFWYPSLLLYTVVAMAFLISFFGRYLPGNIPFGLSIDGLILLAIVVLLVNKHQRFEVRFIINPVALSFGIWMMFTVLMIANPLSKSVEAWFYANRGLSFYPFFLLLLSMYILKSQKHLQVFLGIWALFSVVGTLWGIKQLLLGVSVVEQRWLDAGAASTHVLFGKLRIFSYYSDAAQFGANQAHTAVVFGIIGLYAEKLRYRWIYLVVALFGFYGMLISGTRGALGIIALGGLTYLIMTKKFKVVIAGLLLAVAAFCFLKYTTILQSNYQVNRLRTSLNADDPSLRVRKEREKVLQNYLADKPIGGGIGSAGYWGKRFSPGTLLAEIGTDGHYTRIWMETGIIGLALYLLILIVVIFYLGSQLWRMEPGVYKQKLVAFYCGFTGLCLASYTNGLLTQIPTGVLLFMSLGMVYLGVSSGKKIGAA